MIYIIDCNRCVVVEQKTARLYSVDVESYDIDIFIDNDGIMHVDVYDREYTEFEDHFAASDMNDAMRQLYARNYLL